MVTLLRLVGVSKAFGGVRALRNVSFDLRAGEVHALVGENGAGKSTLIKIVTGAHAPDEGTIEVQGGVIEGNDPLRARALGIAAIYQQPALFPDLTVAENIALGLEPPRLWRRIRWGLRRERAVRLLQRIGCSLSPDTEVRRLTMPEQQLVEIARSLGADARVLIMDEPTASLSDTEVANLFRVINELKAHGVGIVYVSHRLEELPQIADRVTALRDGSLVGTCPMAEVDRPALIRMMVGRELSSVFPKLSVKLGDTVLDVRGLGCREGGVREITLSVCAGEILGLAGLVGAGRTELARVLFGLTPADAGEIRLHGRPVTVGSPAGAVALGIAYVPEDRRRHGVILDMSVSANATLAVLHKVSTWGFLNFRAEHALAADFVARLNVKTPSVETAVGNLSGGNQQKVALARWLAAQPGVLILDEPTQGVDVGAKAEIHRLMGELAGRGIAILMISSELPEILGMSDRIVVMHAGAVAGVLDRAEATQEAVLELALGHKAGVSESLLPSPPVLRGRGVGGEGVQTAPKKDPLTPHPSPLSTGARGTGEEPLTPDPSPLSTGAKGTRSGMMGRYARELSVAAAYAVLLGVLALLARGFFEPDHLRKVVVSNAPLLVAAVGMTLVILARQIDISIGSQFSVCGVVAGLLATAGLPMPGVVLATLLTGAVLGAFNGALVAGLGLPSIIVTLASFVILRDALRWGQEGKAIRDLPAGFQWFGAGQSVGQWLVVGVALVVFLACAWGLRHLALGRAVYATGSDPEAARLAGIRPRRVVFGVFVVMGALAGLAALLNAVRFAGVDPNAGMGLELQAIAAVVVGGVAISGGRGTLIGSLLGVALLGTIGPALVFLKTQPQWERAVQGAIILAAVASDVLQRRRK